MPEVSVPLHALGHFVRVMERRFPGVLDEWVDGLQDEALLNEIVRLRGPRETATVLRVRAGALEWAKHVRLVTLAYFGERLRREEVKPKAPPLRRAQPPQGQRQR